MKMIYFDYFEVLSTPVYKKVFETFIPSNEHPEWMKKLDVLDKGDLSESQLVKEIADRASVSQKEIWNAAQNAPEVNVKLFEYIEKVLKAHYKIGLLTNMPRPLIERMVPEKLPMFDHLIISSDVKMIKPSQEIFNYAIKLCGFEPSDILFIDDSERNIQMASSLGIHTIWFKNNTQFFKEIEQMRGIV